VAIPDFQSIMVPLLEAHLDGQEHRNRDLVKALADRFGLTEKEQREMLPSGRAKLFDNRVGWAKTHITQAGLLASPRRAISVITPLGREVLQRHPDRVDLSILKQYPAYRAFREKRSRKGIFITTSSFTREALEYAALIETKIILIDGVRLARLMFDHDIGVATESIYKVKRIDSDYFSDS
jgi:restriction endonuclease Mrr